MTIESMAEHLDDGTKQSPEQCLRAALEDVGLRDSLKEGKKILILSLDTGPSGREYDITWYQAGMQMSECVALCELAKSEIAKEIFPPE